MSTGASDKTLGLFAKGNFWAGLTSLCAERETKHARAALAAGSWEENLKAKGANSEALLFNRLEEDVKNFVVKQTAATKK